MKKNLSASELSVQGVFNYFGLIWTNYKTDLNVFLSKFINETKESTEYSVPRGHSRVKSGSSLLQST